MTRFGDPYACPDCGNRLPVSAPRCPRCALPLTGPVASRLLATLLQADELLTELRATATAAVATPEAPARTTAPAGHTRYDAVTVPPLRPEQRRGMKPTSVPQILLGLGALCLLVAAVTFLAVAWTWLGIGGRTTVLVALTATTGGAGSLLATRRLRVAGEALTTVSLGLLAMDVLGARNAGWLGSLDDPAALSVVGLVVGVVSLAMTWRPERLVSPQVAAPLAVSALMAGLPYRSGHPLAVETVAVVLLLGLHTLGTTRRVRALPHVAAAAAALWWLELVGNGLIEAVQHPSLRELWLHGHGVGLVTAALLALLPALPWARLSDQEEMAARAGATAAGVLLTLVAILPALDEGQTRATTACLVAVAVWGATSLRVTGRWGLVPRVPLALVAMPVFVTAAGLLAEASVSVFDVGTIYSRGAGVRLAPPDALASPLLLVPVLLALLLTAAGLLRRRDSSDATWGWLVAAATVTALGVTTTLALHAVPLWLPVLCALAAATALAADSLRHETVRGIVEAGTSAAVAGLAVAAAAPSDVLSTIATAAVIALVAAYLLLGMHPAVFDYAELVLLPAIAWFVWSGASVVGLDASWAAVPILLILGLVAVARPRPNLEITAAGAGLVASYAAVLAAHDRTVSLAVHLTLAGALVSLSAIRNPDRRDLGWVGGLLLAAATWTRLYDLGVTAPEAYTLPSATALLVAGLVQLRRLRDTRTSAVLTPGLLLATIPSLLWVIAVEPISLRALLLGLGCLALVLGGSQLHWHAPLLIGATVGGLLVLVEVAPYAAGTPRWVLIGLAGTLLTVVGVTWERRLRDLHQASTYLARLR